MIIMIINILLYHYYYYSCREFYRRMTFALQVINYLLTWLRYLIAAFRAKATVQTRTSRRGSVPAAVLQSVVRCRRHTLRHVCCQDDEFACICLESLQWPAWNAPVHCHGHIPCWRHVAILACVVERQIPHIHRNRSFCEASMKICIGIDLHIGC